MLSHLFGGGPQPPCLQAADTNDDGSVNLTDAIYLLNFLFTNGPAPATPVAACGPDDTADDLGCEKSAGC